MTLSWTTNAQLTLPSASTWLSITPNASSWVSSAWFELTPAASGDWVLTGALFVPDAQQEFELEIGVGSAGAEVPIATFRGRAAQVSNGIGSSWMRLPIPIDAIAYGARVAARLRRGIAGSATCLAAITYMVKPLTGTIQVTSQPLKCAPAAAFATTLASPAAVAWNNSAWTTIIASTSAPIVILGLTGYLSGEAEVDIGMGAAGSEVVVTMIRDQWSATSFGNPNLKWLLEPFSEIPAGSRVALRTRGTSTSGTRTMALLYMDTPL